MSVSLRRIRSHWVLIALAAVIFALMMPIQAQAAFSLSVSASTSVGTGTLSPASNPQVATVGGSGCGLLTQGQMTVSWTATPSTKASGYLVTPVRNSVAQTAISVPLQSSTSVTVNVDRGLANSIQYTFRIQAVLGGWTSSVITTPSASCPLLTGGL
jgi:hypothetical protein